MKLTGKYAYMKCSVSLSLSLCGLSVTNAHGAQMMGAQVEALQRTGYGMYVVRMKPSSHPGTISAFFLYHSDRLWPKSWAELDIEFTPGYQTKGDHARRFVLDHDNGKPYLSCFDPEGKYDTAFFAKNCDISSTENGEVDIARYRNEDGALVNRSLSFNTFGNSPLVVNQSATNKPPVVQPPGDQQVFYNPRVDPYSDFYDYYIWYTPSGVYWSGPVSEDEVRFPEANEIPQTQDFPQPVFSKLWNTTVEGRFGPPADVTYKNAAQKDALAFAANEFTPLDNKTGEILGSGRQLSMMFNIWDGSQTVAALSPQPWGGYQPPHKATTAVYQKVAFFPLKNLKPEATQKRYPGPKDYVYERTSHFSDFTTRDGRFILNGQKASFDQMWMASDGGFAPLGILSGYSVFCYPDEPLKNNAGKGPDTEAEKGIHLQLRNAGDYAIPAGVQPNNLYNSHTNCTWSDSRGWR